VDLSKAIRALQLEKQKLDRVIATLEEFEKDGQPATAPAEPAAGEKKRRGRKSMTAAARQEVSQRMKRYWAARRKQAAARPS